MALTIDELRCPQDHRCPLIPVCPVGAILWVNWETGFRQ